MSDQQGSRPTDPTTTATHRFRTSTPTITTELYEAGFSTLGGSPSWRGRDGPHLETAVAAEAA